MSQLSDKMLRFTQVVLDDASRESESITQQIQAIRSTRLADAENQLLTETSDYVQRISNEIKSVAGRRVSSHMMANKRTLAERREAIADEVFAAVRERVTAFTQTDAYGDHLETLYRQAFAALGNPYDAVVYLREADLGYQTRLAALSPGRHLTFHTGEFLLGGLIIDCNSRMLSADLSYDTVLNDLDGHFAELFGISLSDD